MLEGFGMMTGAAPERLAVKRRGGIKQNNRDDGERTLLEGGYHGRIPFCLVFERRSACGSSTWLP